MLNLGGGNAQGQRHQRELLTLSLPVGGFGATGGAIFKTVQFRQRSVKIADDGSAQREGTPGPGDDDEVIAANMADEIIRIPLLPQGGLQRLGQHA